MNILIRKSVAFYLVIVALLLMSGVVGAQVSPPHPIDSISIVNTHPIISWTISSDSIIGYVIVKRTDNNTNWSNIDSLEGINHTYYIDSSTDACEDFQRYHIYTRFPKTNSPWSVELRTIFLEQPQYDICANTVQLNWTPYINMVGGLSGYRVFASENGGNFAPIDSTAADVIEFTHTNLASGTLYSYKIQAFTQDSTRTSTSCERSILSRTYAKPEFVYLKYATVEDNDHIKIEWLADEAPISKYSVLRSEDDGVTYDTVSRISDLTKYAPPQFYIDTTADFNSQSYYYKIIAWDSCGTNQIESENFARTIFLINDPPPAVSELINKLKWTAYESWPLGVKEYEIYRKVDGPFNPPGVPATVPGSETEYTDDVASFIGSRGQFSYFVKAIEIAGNNGYDSIVDNSISNEITISRESRIFMPNAIMAGSVKDGEFKPVVQFIEQDEYQLIIFNKWGQQLFESREVSKGWMGKYNGEYVPEDTYVYVIRYKDATGTLAEKRGTVTVIR